MKEYQGYWFIDNNQDNKIFGTLCIYENQILLNLCGSFGKLKDIRKHYNIEIINGFTSNGKKLTLINNYIMNQKISVPGMITFEYESEYMIEGKLYHSIDDILIKDISSKYTYLNKWIGKEPFNIKFNQKEKELKMFYKLPNQEIYKLKDYIIKINFRMSTKSDSLTKFIVNQETNIIFENKNNISFYGGLDRIDSFRNFLTLCIGEYITPYGLKATDKSGKKIKINIANLKHKKIKNRKKEDILIPYNIIKNNFVECLNKWDEKEEILEPIIGYLIESYEKDFHIPISFLKIVQALEAFSRRMRDDSILIDEDCNKKVEEIMHELEDIANKNWLKDKLRYSNEPSLRLRLNNIFKETDYLFQLNNKKRNSLAFKIVETRNYFTHFDNNKKSKIMTDNEIYYISKYLLFVLRALILNELGISKEEIRGKISQLEDFDFITDRI